jgi:hypothetical protein
MRKAVRPWLVALIAAAPLALGTAAANAQSARDGVPGFGALVVGTVVSTNPSTDSFIANAYVAGDDGSSTAPVSTQVTITTSPMTLMIVNGRPGSVASMSAGDQFAALFMGSPSQSIQTLTANPALAIFDHTPKVLYGFLGTVTGVDPTAGTVTLTLMDTFPSTLASLGASATFTVGDDTLILGGSSALGSIGGMQGLGESLSNVSTGDILAGVEIGPAGETLAQVEAQPVNLLLDFPAPATGSSGSGTRAGALRDLKALVGGKAIGHSKHSKHHSRHHRRRRARSHRHANRA